MDCDILKMMSETFKSDENNNEISVKQEGEVVVEAEKERLCQNLFQSTKLLEDLPRLSDVHLNDKARDKIKQLKDVAIVGWTLGGAVVINNIISKTGGQFPSTPEEVFNVLVGGTVYSLVAVGLAKGAQKLKEYLDSNGE